MQSHEKIGPQRYRESFGRYYDDFAVGDSPDGHPGHSHRLARSRDAEQFAFVGSVGGDPADDLVPLRDQILDDVPPRCGGDKHHEKLLGAFDARSHSRKRVVRYEVGSHKLVENVGLPGGAGPVDRLEISPYERLVVVG